MVDINIYITILYKNYPCISRILIIYWPIRLGCLTPLSTIFQNISWQAVYWWRKPEYLEKTIDLSQVIYWPISQPKFLIFHFLCTASFRNYIVTILRLVLLWARLTKIYPPLPTSVQPISITKTLLIVPSKNERDPPLFTGKLLIKFQNILRNTTQVIIRHSVKILFSVISSPITLERQKWKS